MSSCHSFCVIIKPDGVRRGLVGKIISRFEKKGYVMKNMKLLEPDDNYVSQLHEHYAEHTNKSFFAGLVKFMTSGNIIVIEFIGDVNVARMIVGESVLPSKCAKGTIRSDYACSIPENLIHCSENIERGQIEVDIWFNNNL